MSYIHTPVSEAFVAWTGGSEPLPDPQLSDEERRLVRALYEAQVASFCAFWGKRPDVGTELLYMTRARYDAHATVRAGCAGEFAKTGLIGGTG